MIGTDSKLKEKGLTLLEALVATAIVGIGFIAVFRWSTIRLDRLTFLGKEQSLIISLP